MNTIAKYFILILAMLLPVLPVRAGLPEDVDAAARTVIRPDPDWPAMLPYFSQSDFIKGRVPISMPLNMGYTVEPAPGAIATEFSQPPKISFSVRWEIRPVAAVRNADQMKAAFESLKDQWPKDAVRGELGENSCVAAIAAPGSADLFDSDDPYHGEGTAFLSIPQADMAVHVAIILYSPPSHGARNKPAVLDDLKTTCDRQVRYVTALFAAAIDRGTGGNQNSPAASWNAEIKSASSNDVQVSLDNGQTWRSPTEHMKLPDGAILQTAGSTVEIILPDASTLKLADSTEVRFNGETLGPWQMAAIALKSGRMEAAFKPDAKSHSQDIMLTPHAMIGGTVFTATADRKLQQTTVQANGNVTIYSYDPTAAQKTLKENQSTTLK